MKKILLSNFFTLCLLLIAASSSPAQKIETKDGRNIKTLNLRAIDFTTRSTKAYSLMGGKFNSKNFISSFSLFSPNKNQALITRVFNKMVQLEEIDSDVAVSLREKLVKYQKVSDQL